MNDRGNAYEIHALSGAYAVDALDEAEKAQFEEHLAACPTCQAEVAELQEATALMAETTQAEPPAALRDSVLAGIRTVRPLPPEVTAPVRKAEVRRLPVRRRLTALAVAAAVLGIAGTGTAIWQENRSSQPTVSVADRVLQAADAKRVNLTLPGGVSASVIRSVSEGRAVLVTHRMPAPPSGRIYELWFQTPAGKMVPAGTMGKPGTRPVVLRGDATNATAVGITVEPDGGSQSPSSDPIALFDFEQAT
jgi:anti-sigma-K factor RskA